MLACIDLLIKPQLTIHSFKWSWFYRLARSTQLHYLWKKLQLGGLHENSYWPPMACILIPTTALSVERASAGRTSWKLILAAHGGWSLQLQCMWKKLQLGALHENSCSPPSSKRKAWLENTPFALSNFSRTGWVYTGSSRIYSAVHIHGFITQCSTYTKLYYTVQYT